MQPRTRVRAALYARVEYEELQRRIAVNVRRLRTERGWTQDECARACGEMPPPVLQGIEAGRANATTATLARLAKGLAVDPSELFAPIIGPVEPRKAGRPRKTPKT